MTQVNLSDRAAVWAEFWRLYNWEPDAIVEVGAVDTRLPSWDTDELETVHTAYGYTDAIGADRIWFRWETCDSECDVDLSWGDGALDAIAGWRHRLTEYLLGCRVLEAEFATAIPQPPSNRTYEIAQMFVRAAQVSLYAALTGLTEDEAQPEVDRTTGYRPKDSRATDGVEPITDLDDGWGHSHAYRHLLTMGDY